MKLWTGLLLAIPLALQAADRDTAEWAIRQGGRVMVNGSRAALRNLRDLPAGDIAVTGVDLTGTLIEPKDLERIGQLAHLRELYLPGPSFNPASGSRLDANDQLKFLSGLKELERLDFSLHFLPNVNVLDKGLALLTGLTQLKQMRCAQCRISKLSFAAFTNLESLDLNLSTLRDEGLKSLAGLKHLRRLYLRDTLITDDGLEALSGLADLEELDLGGLNLSDRGIAHLKSLTKLRKLNLLGAEITTHPWTSSPECRTCVS
jgi:hypothetical protein